MHRSQTNLFEELGGELVLRMIIDRFIDRVFADPMIGFFFRHADRERIKSREYELSARHLGAHVEYTGRPLDRAHRAHPILGSHFDRRLAILEQTLTEFEVPEAILRHWLEHDRSQRALVTGSGELRCADPAGASEPDPKRKEAR